MNVAFVDGNGKRVMIVNIEEMVDEIGRASCRERV